MKTPVAYRAILCLFVLNLGLQASSMCTQGVNGETCTVGQPALTATGNCDPFGCASFFGLGTYQQVYLDSAFQGALSIASLTFFDTQVHNGGNPDGGTYTLSLSYTTAQPGALDTTSPDNNIGSGSAAFFTGTLPALTSIGPGARELTLTGTPFLYDPSLGNLLLTLTVDGSTDGVPFLYLDQAVDTSQTGNAYFGTTSGGNDIGGLVTAFSGQPGVSGVPEPGSLLLVLAGAGLVGFRLRGRRTR